MSEGEPVYVEAADVAENVQSGAMAIASGPDLTPEQAGKLTLVVRERMETLEQLLRILHRRRGHVALGYADWPAYADAELPLPWPSPDGS